MVQGRIIKRLLGQPSNDSSSDQNVPFEARLSSSFLRPTSSQYACLSLASPITCIDRAPKGGHAVIAGEKIFKTVKIDGSEISEEVDLRAAISSQLPPNDNTLSAFNDQLNIKAVGWSHGELDTTIVTASANGRVTLYDLNRVGSGVEIGRIREHARQVHKLAVNPWRGNWLLSACQDGTARLFDIRSAVGRTGQTFHSWSIFKCNADAVRDIKWSPNDGFKFACSTASGTVLHWDTRKPNAPILKFSAHDSACLSISWHPDGEHLITGGLDQHCYVWDLSERAERRQKAKYTIDTPAPVSIVSWRPACWSSTAQARRAAQIVVVYDDTNPMRIQNSTVHIWDVARPSLPFKEITTFETSPTGLHWHERDLLWTVGKEGNVTQTDIAFIPKVIDRRSLSTFDFSPSGDVLMLLEERQGRRHARPRPPVTTPIADIQSHDQNMYSQSQSPSGVQLSISRSDSEEDVGGSFLGPRARSKKPGHRLSSRPVSSLSTTPPSLNSTDLTIMNLDDALKFTGPYKPQQVMAVGHAPSSINRKNFQYLSSKSLSRIVRDLRDARAAGAQGPPIGDRVATIMAHFVKLSSSMGQFRLAQTWTLLSYAMSLLLTRRAEYHRGLRLARQDEKTAEREREETRTKDERQRRTDPYFPEDGTPRKIDPLKPQTDGLMRPVIKSILAEEIESTSNMTTPLARPMRDSMIYDSTTAGQVTAIENDELELSPAAPSSASPIKIHYKTQKKEDSSPTLDGYDFYGMEGLSTPAININPPQRKAPFRLDVNYKDQGSSPRVGALARHDSNESFQMFSTSGDSQPRKFTSPSDSGGHASIPGAAHRSVLDFESSWESSAASSISRQEKCFGEEVLGDLRVSQSHVPPENSHMPPTFRVKNVVAERTRHQDDRNGDKDNALVTQSLEDDEADSPNRIDSDYAPFSSDPQFLANPIDPHIIVPRAMQFELQTGSLNAAVMILLLKPLLKPDTVDEIQAAAILREYHQRLDSMMLFTEAGILRKLCYPDYPSVYNLGQPKNIGSVGYYCTTCEKPVQVGDLALGQRLQKCYRCNTYFDGCAVCQLREDIPLELDSGLDEAFLTTEGDAKAGHERSSLSSPAARLWWWCQGCGHGGHTTCMRTWHHADGSSISGGCCPVQGCLHPCLPGVWRTEFFAQNNMVKSEKLSRLVKEGTRQGTKGARAGGVMKDKAEAIESKAVESVRGALVGSSGSGERERKKSVKVVAPGESS